MDALLTEIERSNRRRRVVSFANRTKVHTVKHVNDYTDEELCSTFQQPKDIKANQHEIVETVRHVRKHGIKSLVRADSLYCSRGLEAIACPQTLKTKQANKSSVIDAVLDEQDRQWDAGIFPSNWQRIAQASALHSQSSRDEALTLGTKDAAMAKSIHRRRRLSLDDLPTLNLTGESRSSSKDDELPLSHKGTNVPTASTMGRRMSAPGYGSTM